MDPRFCRSQRMVPPCLETQCDLSDLIRLACASQCDGCTPSSHSSGWIRMWVAWEDAQLDLGPYKGGDMQSKPALRFLIAFVRWILTRGVVSEEHTKIREAVWHWRMVSLFTGSIQKGKRPALFESINRR